MAEKKKWFGVAAFVTAIGAAGTVLVAKSKAARGKAVETFESARSAVSGHSESSEGVADDVGAAASEPAEEHIEK